MSEYNISKSRYCNAVQCPKMLWLKKNKPEVFDDSVMNEAVLETGNEVGDLAMGIFGDYIEVPFDQNVGLMVKETERLLEENTPVIAEASFTIDGLFCSVDIFRYFGEKQCEIYEVKSSTSIREIYYHDVAFQNYVLTKLGYNVKKVCLVHINNTYVRKGDLDLDQLFEIEDVTDWAHKLYNSVDTMIPYIKAYMRKRKEPEEEIRENCFSPYMCGFFSYCSAGLPRPNVFDLAALQLKTKVKYYNEGLVSFKDLEKSGKLKEKQKMQIEYELHPQEDYIDKESIKEFLETITYPLYYLDFEAFQPAIPLYDDSSPYEQIPFQYSLHYQKRKDGKLYHKEFLAYPYSDPRREVAEHLCKDIPKDVCVLAYNMSFEKGRIKRLAGLYPDLSDHLMNIHDHIIDLITPFQKRWYYSRMMQGSYSIKYVLPALFPDDPELDYHNLEGVHNGSEASDVFRRMADMNKDTLNENREYLLKYCKLDTYAMVKVLQKLYETVKQ